MRRWNGSRWAGTAYLHRPMSRGTGGGCGRGLSAPWTGHLHRLPAGLVANAPNDSIPEEPVSAGAEEQQIPDLRVPESPGGTIGSLSDSPEDAVVSDPPRILDANAVITACPTVSRGHSRSGLDGFWPFGYTNIQYLSEVKDHVNNLPYFLSLSCST